MRTNMIFVFSDEFWFVDEALCSAPFSLSLNLLRARFTKVNVIIQENTSVTWQTLGFNADCVKI